MNDFLLYAVISVVGIFLSAVFAGFENGMVSVRKARLDHAVEQGSWAASLIQRFLHRPTRMLATVLLGTNLAHCFTAIYFDKMVGAIMGPGKTNLMTQLLSTGVLVLIMLIFAEITPKVWFRQRPFHRCSLFVLPIYGFYLATSFAVWTMTAFVGMLNRLFHTGKKGDQVLMREDFRTMVRESEEEGLLPPEGRQLLENSLGYSKFIVSQLMVPTEKVATLPGDATLAQAVELSRNVGFARFPVENPTTPGQWTGMFSVYDAVFFVPPERWETETILPYLRPLVSIANSATVSDVLKSSRKSKCPQLSVVDESGAYQGIITVEDVVRPLFGNFRI